jgi:FG-GAP-like repeat
MAIRSSMIAVNYATNKASIFFSQGNGLFAAPADYSTGQEPRAVISVDVDADGDLDLATANNLDDNVSVLTNQGNGTFAAAVNHSTRPNMLFAAVAADVNGDGHVDITAYQAASLTVFLNQGNGTFGAKTDHSLLWNDVTYEGGQTLADVNNDGYLDAAATWSAT